MRADLHDHIVAVEEHHWWFQARKRIILDFLARAFSPPDPVGIGGAPGAAGSRGTAATRGGGTTARTVKILDVGSGTGMLAKAMTALGHVTAMEGAPEAVAHLARRGGLRVIQGYLPHSDLAPDAFDLVTAFDVLEHIEDDRSALGHMVDLVKPGGSVLLTVPTHPWLWSPHDEASRHFRRYRPHGIEELVRGAGLTVLFSSPFQTLLFPMMIAERWAQRSFGAPPEGQELRLPPRWINATACTVFAMERHWISRQRRAPVGSSHLIFAQKPAA